MDNKLKNSKVCVVGYSIEVQEKLFELGFEYSGSGKKINLKSPFLFINDNGNITISNDLEYFNNHSYRKITPEYILSLEVNKKPKWEDFGEVVGYYIDDIGNIRCYSGSSFITNRNIFPTKQDAEACIALSQLLQWRDKYNDGWEPDYTDYNESKFVITFFNEEIIVTGTNRYRYVLAFKSAEIRDKFVNDFEDLIEQAKPLL